MAVIDTDTEAGKAELQKLLEDALSGVKAKNDELLGEVKKYKADAKALADGLAELKAAKERSEQEALEKTGDVDKIKQALESRFEKERNELLGKYDAVKGNLHNLLVENGLTDALTKSGVAPQFLDAAKALIKAQGQVDIAEVNGSATALISGKTVTDFVSDWAKGDNGKHFISAPLNGGGGASGSNGNSGAGAVKQMKRSDFDSLPADKRMEVSKAGVQLTEDL